MDLATLTLDDGIKISGVTPQDQTGAGMLFIERNEDGISDLFVSAPAASLTVPISCVLQVSRTGAGIIYVILGKTTGLNNINIADFDNTYRITIIGAVDNDGIGQSLFNAGDIDGDGQRAVSMDHTYFTRPLRK